VQALALVLAAQRSDSAALPAEISSNVASDVRPKLFWAEPTSQMDGVATETLFAAGMCVLGICVLGHAYRADAISKALLRRGLLELYTKDDKQRSVAKHIGRLEARLAARKSKIQLLDHTFGNKTYSLAPLPKELPTAEGTKKCPKNEKLALQACEVQPLEIRFHSEEYLVRHYFVIFRCNLPVLNV
jgi:hypothetical protein